MLCYTTIFQFKSGLLSSNSFIKFPRLTNCCYHQLPITIILTGNFNCFFFCFFLLLSSFDSALVDIPCIVSGIGSIFFYYYFFHSHIHWIYKQLLCMYTSVPKPTWTLTHSFVNNLCTDDRVF